MPKQEALLAVCIAVIRRYSGKTEVYRSI